jgi:hypothetical protein
MIDSLFLSQFQMLYIQLIRQSNSSIHKSTGNRLTIGQYSAGVQIRLTGEEAAKQRPPNMHQRQYTDYATILLGPKEPWLVPKSDAKDIGPLRVQMKPVIAPASQVLIPARRGSLIASNCQYGCR